MSRVFNIYCFCILLFAIILTWLNHSVPLLPGDDFMYAMQFPEEGYPGTERIDSYKTYFNSVKNHYLNYNNRILPHAVLQIILLMPRFIFDLINSLVFLLCPAVILMATPGLKSADKLKLYTAILALTWIFHPDLGRAYFWTSGALNYTWFLLFQLYFAILMVRKFSDGKRFGAIAIILALLICTSNEHIVLSFFIVCSYLLFRDVYYNRRQDYNLILSTWILLLGGIIMLYSPALLERFHSREDGYLWPFVLTAENSFRTLLYVFYFLSCGLILMLFSKIGKPGRQSLFILGLIVLSTGIMYFTPLYEPRAAVFPYYLSFMFFVSFENKGSLRVWPIALILIISGLILPDRWLSAYELKDNIRYLEEELTARYPANDTVLVDKLCYPSFNSAIPCEDVFFSVSHMNNRSLAAFYKLEAVSRRDESDCFLREGKIDTVFSSQKGHETIGLEGVYTRLSDGSLCLAVLLSPGLLQTDTTIILRAARDGIAHKMLRSIPESYRIYFLDYLEEDMSVLKKDNETFLIRHLRSPESYDYFILSAYSKRQHKAIGATYLIQNPFEEQQ